MFSIVRDLGIPSALSSATADNTILFVISRLKWNGKIEIDNIVNLNG